MADQSVVNGVILLVYEESGRTANYYSDLFDELGLDSLSLLHLLQRVEAKFDCRIDGEWASKVQTVGDIVDAVEQAMIQCSQNTMAAGTP